MDKNAYRCSAVFIRGQFWFLTLPGAAMGEAWGVRADGADALEEDGGGFVVGVLGDEFAFEGFLEDGLTEAV